MKLKKMRQIHTAIEITDDDNLKLLGEAFGNLPKSEIIRMAIKNYIDENKEIIQAQKEIEAYKQELMKEQRKKLFRKL